MNQCLPASIREEVLLPVVRGESLLAVGSDGGSRQVTMLKRWSQAQLSNAA